MTRAVGKRHAVDQAGDTTAQLVTDAESLDRVRVLAGRSGLTPAEWLDERVAELEQKRPETLAKRRKSVGGQGPPAMERRTPNLVSVASLPSDTPVGPARRLRASVRALDPSSPAADLARLMTVLGQVVDRLDALERRVALPAGRPSRPDRSAGGAGERQDAARLEAAKAFEVAVGRMSAQVCRSEARAELQALHARESLRALQHRVALLESELAERLNAREGPGSRPCGAAPAGDASALATGGGEEASAHVHPAPQPPAGLPLRLEQSAARPPLTPSRVGASHAPPGLDVDPTAASPPSPTVTLAAAVAQSDGDGPLRQVESAVRGLSDQMAAGQQRSVTAIHRMGHEVIRLAQTLDGRVDAVERRSTEQAQEIGGRMSRIAGVMDDRLARAEDERVDAFQQLGAAITGVADHLTDAISASERRNAKIVEEGLDDVSARVKRAVHTMNTHRDAMAAEFDRKIRQRDEHDAKQVRKTEQPGAAPSAASVVPLASASPGETGPAPAAAPAAPVQDGRATPSVPRAGGSAAARYAARPFEPIAKTATLGGMASLLVPPAAPAEPRPQRDLIEQARAAARLNAEASPQPGWKGWVAALEAPGSKPADASRPVLVLRDSLGGLLRRAWGAADADKTS